MAEWNDDDAAARRRSKGYVSAAVAAAAAAAAAAEGSMCARHPRAIGRYCICQGGWAERTALVPIRNLQLMLDTMRVTQRACIVVDVNERATTYLKYIDSNYLQFCKPDDLARDVVRMAALGAARYGKPLVMDCSDVALNWQDLTQVFDSLRLDSCIWLLIEAAGV